MAQRFSTIAGITLGIIAITATYNAWLEVGRLHALWETTYGQLIMVKVILLLILVVLGASNRYISVPLLQRLAGHSLPDQEALHLNPFQRKLELVQAARRFMQKVWAESVIVILVLICTALLLHQMPSRHISHTGHGHNMKKSKIEEKRAYDGLCLTRCAAWEKGVR
jgi:putative copper export protein